MNERQFAMTELFNKCAIKYNNNDIRKMKYNHNDRGTEQNKEYKQNKEYSMCYNKNDKNSKKYCGPDWTFYHWSSANMTSFEETKNEIIKASQDEPVINKVGWVGNIYSPLPDVIEYKTRPLLIKIGQEHADIFEFSHVPSASINLEIRNQKYVTLIDLMKYKYLIDIGGNGYSGRLKLLLSKC